MDTARSSLSTFVNIDGVPVGLHPVITRFMKGVFSIKSVLPKHNFAWDVGIVVTYVPKIDTNSLKYVRQKLATLLVLLCGQRCGEILSVLDIGNLDLSENMCVIRIGDLLKTSELFKAICRSNEATQGQHYFLIHYFEQTIQGDIERYVSDCNWTRTHNHLLHKRTLTLASLAKWLSVRL